MGLRAGMVAGSQRHRAEGRVRRFSGDHWFAGHRGLSGWQRAAQRRRALGQCVGGWQVATDWTVATGVRYVGKRYADTANTLQLPGYATTDVTVSWQARPATRLTARVFNAFDKTFYETAYYTDTQWLRGADRRVEFTVDHRF